MTTDQACSGVGKSVGKHLEAVCVNRVSLPWPAVCAVASLKGATSGSEIDQPAGLRTERGRRVNQ